MQAIDTDTKQANRARVWLARAGKAGFLFFLVKGIAWLTVPLAVGLLNLLALWR